MSKIFSLDETKYKKVEFTSLNRTIEGDVQVSEEDGILVLGKAGPQILNVINETLTTPEFMEREKADGLQSFQEDGKKHAGSTSLDNLIDGVK